MARAIARGSATVKKVGEACCATNVTMQPTQHHQREMSLYIYRVDVLRGESGYLSKRGQVRVSAARRRRLQMSLSGRNVRKKL